MEDEHKCSGLGLVGLCMGLVAGGIAGVSLPPIFGYHAGEYISEAMNLNPWLDFMATFGAAAAGALISPHAGKLTAATGALIGNVVGATGDYVLSIPNKALEALVRG